MACAAEIAQVRLDSLRRVLWDSTVKALERGPRQNSTTCRLLRSWWSAQGRTDLNFRFSALNAVVVPVAVMTGCYLGGTHGVAIALCLVCPATAGYRLSMAVMVLREVSYTDFFRTLRSPVVIAAACVVVMLPFDWLMPSGLARLVVRSGVGMLCYCSCLIGVRSVREQLVHAAGPAAQQFLERLRPSRKNKS